MRFGVSSGVAPARADEEINLGTIGRALWRKKLWIVGPTLIMALAAFAAVSLITPRYQSEARVLIESRENIFLRPEAEKTMLDRNPVDAETVTSQVQLVLSRDLAREVIKDLHLADLPEFNAALRDFSPLALLAKIGILKNPLSMSLEERVLAAYYDRLTAFAVDKSRVIAIEFQSADPDLAARIANLIAEKYLTFQQLAKQDEARAASKWLSGELDKLRKRVSDSEAKVEEFRAKSNLFVGSNNTSLTNQQLTDLNSQVSAARAQKADAEARAQLIRDAIANGRSLESSDIANSELIRRLSEQRVTLRGQLAEQMSVLLPQHPRIKAMKAQIADLDQQIRSEGERLARSLEHEAKVAGARLNSLSATLDQLKKQTASASDQDVQLRGLEREAKAQRDLFESYLAKYREAAARDSIAAAPADARVISRATVSNVPYFPKKMPIVLIAALGALCLSTAFVVTRTLISGVEEGSAPMQMDAAIALGAAPPALGFRPVPGGDVVLAASPLIEEVAMAVRQAGEGGRRIAVIGGARNVGTTLTAIALSRVLSRSGRVVLVDLAFGAPNVDVISNDPGAPGIADLVAGTASFGDIITRDRASRAHLVAAGQVGSDASELITSPLLSAAVAALAQSYDHLIVDAGAQSETALEPIARAAPYAVVVGGENPADTLNAVAEQIQSAGFAEVMVLTGPPPILDRDAVPSAA